jgi:hypothetical protein
MRHTAISNPTDRTHGRYFLVVKSADPYAPARHIEPRRWLYPTDRKRANEYGIAYEAEAVALPAPSVAPPSDNTRDDSGRAAEMCPQMPAVGGGEGNAAAQHEAEGAARSARDEQGAHAGDGVSAVPDDE